VKAFTPPAMRPPYKTKIRRIFRISDAMGKDTEMPTEKARALLNQTIEACLLDGSIQERLNIVKVCIGRLEDYGDEVPEELRELKDIVAILSCYGENLSPEHDFELTERLLTLYISVSDGALIF
jgi:hypothetical protein